MPNKVNTELELNEKRRLDLLEKLMQLNLPKLILQSIREGQEDGHRV